MPETVIEGPPTVADVPDNVVQLALSTGALPVQLGPSGELPTREQCLAELRAVHRAMRVWYGKEPDQVMREASAFSSRLAELRMDVMLAASVDRGYSKITTFINHCYEEVYRQSRWASRQVAVRGQDLELTR